MTKPPSTFFSFLSSHAAANAAVDYGFADGNYIVELIGSLNGRRNTRLAGHYFFRLQKDANNDIRIDSDGAGAYRIVVVSAAGTSTYPLHLGLFSFDVMTLVINTIEFSAYLDGQKIISDTVTPRKPNLSGACTSTILAGTGGASVHDLCGVRVTEEASLPAGLVADIQKRSMNPWDRSAVLSAPLIEYLMTVASNPNGAKITNSANPGVGDLDIAPAGLFGDVVQKYAIGYDEQAVRFSTTAVTIDPETTVAGTPTVLWDFEDWGLSGQPDPGTIDFKRAGLRHHTLEACEWSAVTQLRVEADSISSIENLRLLTGLTYLNVSDNDLTTVDVSQLSTLTYLLCHNNSIAVLDVSRMAAMLYISCGHNNISVLDVSGMTAMTYLSCGTNLISVLDVTACTNLLGLYCSDNYISVLDVSALAALQDLYCDDNFISVLDVAAATNLLMVFAENNALSSGVVDNVLIALDAHGLINGTCELANQTPAAPPGPAGAAAKASLIAKGWAVTTD